jgi:exonuclease III
MTILHFNARSIYGKFNEISTELKIYDSSVICITETWLHAGTTLGLYDLNGYCSYSNCRSSKLGGGCSIYVRKELHSQSVASDVTSNDAFNVCAVLVGSRSNLILLVLVYRAPWATSSDNKELCTHLELISARHRSLVIVGDFNLPQYKPSGMSPCVNITNHPILRFISENNLTQLVQQPSRLGAFLDLIFVSPNFANSNVTYLPPIAGSDHSSQLLSIQGVLSPSVIGTTTAVNVEHLNSILSLINWDFIFSGCLTVDDFAFHLESVLKESIMKCTTTRCRFRRQRLPRHIVMLLRAKKKAWRRGQLCGNLDPYYELRRTTQAAIRQFRRNTESRLIYNGNRSKFFAYINRSLGKSRHPIQINVNGVAVSDNVAANTFSQYFATHFSQSKQLSNYPESRCDITLQHFNCTENDIILALKSCSTSNCSIDGISYRILKSVAQHIIYPLKVICQHSFNDGLFPSMWKQATISPLYKGQGDRASVDSYRPISICSCLGKIVEKVACSQLSLYIHSNNLLLGSQHGFVPGKSTLTNLLEFDHHIANALTSGHPYDIVSFDLKKAFDKAPHHRIAEALAEIGICSRALSWLINFLAGRSQRVRVADNYSNPTCVTSGLVQGSCLGPILWTVFVDKLLRRLHHNNVAFADDFKFCADVSISNQNDVQDDINVVINWSKDYDMPLSTEKTLVMHCGPRQPYHVYHLDGRPLNSVDHFSDLGIVRCSNGGYSTHYINLVNKARKIGGAIRHTFLKSNKKLLWPAFETYVIPILMYCCQAWNTNKISDIKLIESVQRRFTKGIFEVKHLSYLDRLRELDVLSLENRRFYADMVLLFRCLHGQLGVIPAQLGISTTSSCTRGNGTLLKQRRATSKVTDKLFCVRVPPLWNKLPRHVTECKCLSSFKRLLLKHLASCQANQA